MRNTLSGWEVELVQWLKPFLNRLGHKARRRMCPLYVMGLIGPGDRKSVQPMAERLAPGDYDQLHHCRCWRVGRGAVRDGTARSSGQAGRRQRCVMVIDDTAVPKKGKHSVGVAWQYASALGKNAGASSSRALRRFAERHARHLAGRAQTLQDARKPMHTDPSTI